MHKYKIIKSDLLLNGKIIPENSEMELSDKQIKGIENFLIECHSDPDLSADKAGLSGEESPKSHFEHSEESLNTKTEQKNKTKRGNK